MSEIDPLDFWARNELCLAQTAQGRSDLAGTSLQSLTHLMRDDVQSYLELATDYMHAGMFSEAVDVLQRIVSAGKPPASVYPLVHYYLGYLHQQLGHVEAADECFERRCRCPRSTVFHFAWRRSTY